MMPLFQTKGHCPICRCETVFNAWSENLRDTYLCGRCASIPRERALICALDRFRPGWWAQNLHESSPSDRAVSRLLSTDIASYVETQYHPSIALGAHHPTLGWRCEDLERQTFEDERFDIVVTQDVFEHVFDPVTASREIARTLRPGGLHVFTTPLVWGDSRETVVCARRTTDGRVEHVQPPEYHRNPVDPEGSLVTHWWGYDIVDILDAGGLTSSFVWKCHNPDQGIIGPLTEVVISVALARPIS